MIYYLDLHHYSNDDYKNNVNLELLAFSSSKGQTTMVIPGKKHPQVLQLITTSEKVLERKLH